MSTTTREPSVRRRPIGLDPATTPAAELYPEYIVDNEDLCSYCFRQQYDAGVVSETTAEKHGDILAARVVTRHDGTEEVQEHQNLQRTPEWTRRGYFRPRKGEGPADAKRTFCTCGDVDGAEIRTRSKAEAVDHAANLSAVLDRWGVENDWLGLIRMVSHAKCQPKWAAHDDRCLDFGVTYAVRVARELDPKPSLATVLKRYQ